MYVRAALRKALHKSNLEQLGTEYTNEVNYICIHKEVQLKLKLRNTGTWSAAEWPLIDQWWTGNDWEGRGCGSSGINPPFRRKD